MITDWELTTYARALRADPRFDPSFRQLVDLRGVEAFDLTIHGVRELASLNPFAATARRAVIVRDDCAFGMVRMYQSCLPNAESLLVCRDMRDAIEWIGLDASTPVESGPSDWISRPVGLSAPNG
jgi:hypothetical protein